MKTYSADYKTMNTSYGIIWQILNCLDLALDYPEVPADTLTAKRFKITENRFNNYLIMLENTGYIEGVEIIETIDGNTELDISEIKITLEGIQFLIENSVMNKIASCAKTVGLKVAEAGVTLLAEKLK
ncbi:MAG: hypothetical protein IJJ70_07810 [Treponema sp.]|nr:hypothetical protein [Treponema sp.]